MEIKELETADYDLLENVKAAFYRLWKLKTVVLLVTLISLLSFFLLLAVVGNHEIYRSGASIYSVVYGSFEESNAGARVMNTYASVLGTPRVCDRAAQTLNDPELNSDRLSRMVRNGEIYLIGASNNTRDYSYRLTLVMESTSSYRIVDIPNAMAQAFVDEINDLIGQNSLQVVEAATMYSVSNSINVKMGVLLFTLGGFFLSAGLIFVKEFFASKVYTVGQCERDRDFILGIVPYSTKN